jgi:hypothetical protein
MLEKHKMAYISLNLKTNDFSQSPKCKRLKISHLSNFNGYRTERLSLLSSSCTCYEQGTHCTIYMINTFRVLKSAH